MRAVIICVLFVMMLSGCVQHQPAISDISDAAVKVQLQINPFVAETDISQVDAEARRGCGLYDKVATRLSSRCVAFDGAYCKIKEFLYSCN